MVRTLTVSNVSDSIEIIEIVLIINLDKNIHLIIENMLNINMFFDLPNI